MEYWDKPVGTAHLDSWRGQPADRKTEALFGVIPLVVMLALGGCAGNPAAPTPSIALSTSFHHGENRAPGDFSRDYPWWREFGDEQLVRLVERTAMANHDIRIAVERARQARAGIVAAESRLFPSLDVTADRSDSRTGLPAAIKQSTPDTKATRAGVDVSWEIDLFGGARAAASAAEKDAASASLSISAAQLISASEVARQYFIWHGARQRLTTLESMLQTQRDTERLTRSRKREGLASEFDVARAAGETLSTKASLPQLRTLMATTENRIAVLTGSDASTPVPELHAAVAFHWTSPKEAFTGQPADLLRRRPDLLVAEQRLDAESSRLAEAKANRFPKIFLSALFGTQKLTLNDALTLPASRYSNVAAAFVLPIFDAGRIKAGIDAQSARERESLLSYEQVILGAIEDVENSLAALNGERQRVDSLTFAVRERERAVTQAMSLFREGQIDLLQLLDVQRAQLAADLALTESCAQRAVDYIQLYKALGGGWQALPASVNASIAGNSSSGVNQ
jgi:NodT family efflux transporter outer membrane factor (OMF) lipoprotein